MLKNVKIIKIGPRLDMPIERLRLRDMGENNKIHFFQVFHFELYFHFHNNISS